MNVDWGTVPDWVAAVGTVGALLIGLRLLGKQMTSLRATEDDRRKRQAYNVGAWWEPVEEGTLYRFHVRNANPTPIYNCIVMLRGANKPLGVAIMSIGIPVVSPQDTVVEERDAAEVHSEDVRTAAVELGFTDSDGRHWLRTRTGHLEELEEPARSC